MTTKKHKGQTVLFVVLILTIALAVGVSVANRTVRELSSTSRTDTSVKAAAAAEGGIERALLLNKYELASVAGGDCVPIDGVYTTSGGLPVCVISFGASGDDEDTIDAKAEVNISLFNSNSPTSREGYFFDLSRQSVKDINLKSVWPQDAGNQYTNLTDLNVCFSPKDPAFPVALSYTLFFPSSAGQVLRKEIIMPLAGVQGAVTGGAVTADNSNKWDGFTDCETFTLMDGVNKADSIVLRSLYGDASVAVYGYNSAGSSIEDLPLIGYMIQSTGSAGGVANEVQAIKKVTVLKTFHLAQLFDFVVVTPGNL